MRYVSYSKTRNAARADFPSLAQPGDRIALTVVASIWENEHGKFWAAYLGDGGLPLAEIANTGSKMPRKVAEELYPQIVAAGYEWWD